MTWPEKYAEICGCWSACDPFHAVCRCKSTCFKSSIRMNHCDPVPGEDAERDHQIDVWEPWDHGPSCWQVIITQAPAALCISDCTRDTETASHVTVWHETVTNIWTFGNRALIQAKLGLVKLHLLVDMKRPRMGEVLGISPFRWTFPWSLDCPHPAPLMLLIETLWAFLVFDDFWPYKAKLFSPECADVLMGPR